MKELNRYYKLKMKIALIYCDIAFLKRCLKMKVCPKFIQKSIRSATKGRGMKTIIHEARRKFMRLEIRGHYARMNMMKAEAYSLELFLMKNLHFLVWEEKRKWIMGSLGRKCRLKKIRLKKKFEAIMKESSEGQHQGRDERVQFIINKSSHELSRKEEEILKNSLKYQPQPKSPPINEIIVAIETSIKYLPEDTKSVVRDDVMRVLEERKHKRYAGKDDWKVIEELKRKDIIFLAPDKGKGVVIMDKHDYIDAAIEHLSNEKVYEGVKTGRDYPVDILQTKLKRGLRELIRKGLLSESEMRQFIISNPTIPSFSCLPKIHKEGNKIRPVVSDIYSPSSKISRWLVRKFKLYEKPESFSVKNSFELTREIKGVRVGEDECLISFDVEALYPSVPVDKAFEIFNGWIHSQDISDQEAELVLGLTEIVLEQRWLQFDGKIYQQKSGLSIGNPLSPILAELFMSRLEIGMSGESWYEKISFWRRYVDDVIAVVKKDSVGEVLIELNKRHKDIKFTCEMESNNSIPFLDTRLIKEKDGISFDIYRKPTDKPLCIPYNSHHDLNHRLAAFESMCYRAWNLPLSDELRRKELEYIVNMAVINGYRREVVESISRKHERRIILKSLTTLQSEHRETMRKITDRAGNDVMRTVVLPHFAPLTNPIKKVLKRNNINVCFKNRRTLRDIIGGLKKKTGMMEKSGIYRIPCQNCEMQYCGQTKRRLETRDKEHARAVKNRQREKSSVAKHCVDERHRKGEMELMIQVKDHNELDAYESLCMSVSSNLMNEAESPISSRLFKYATTMTKRVSNDDD